MARCRSFSFGRQDRRIFSVLEEAEELVAARRRLATTR
jgi:hypothetical protein